MIFADKIVVCGIGSYPEKLRSYAVGYTCFSITKRHAKMHSDPVRHTNASLLRLRRTNAASTLHFTTLSPFRLWHTWCSWALTTFPRGWNICLQRCRRGAWICTTSRGGYLCSRDHKFILLFPASRREMEVTWLAGYRILIHVFIAILLINIQGFFEKSNVKVVACIYVRCQCAFFGGLKSIWERCGGFFASMN